jgi:hypothetical protein
VGSAVGGLGIGAILSKFFGYGFQCILAARR